MLSQILIFDLVAGGEAWQIYHLNYTLDLAVTYELWIQIVSKTAKANQSSSPRL